jgi:hypothetical protein
MQRDKSLVEPIVSGVGSVIHALTLETSVLQSICISSLPKLIPAEEDLVELLLKFASVVLIRLTSFSKTAKTEIVNEGVP